MIQKLKPSNTNLQENNFMLNAFKILTLILLPTVLYSQANFQRGYIVSQTGDTLRGEIDNRDWSKSPEVIRFRKNKNSETQRFNAYQCQAFGIEAGLSYQSIRTTLYQTKENYNEAKFDIVQDTTVFMEILSKGKLTLYEFVEKGEKSRYFVQASAIKTEQLIYHSYYEATNIVHKRKYQTQLAELTNKNANNVPYERNYLIKFINQYNNIGVNTDTKKKEKGVNLQIGLGASYYNNLSIVRHDYGNEIANFGSNIQPAIGINANFPFSTQHNAFSFDVGILFSSYTSKKVSGDSYLSVKKVHTNNLFFSIATKYAFFAHKETRPYMGMGVGINEPIGDYLIRNDGSKVKLPLRPQNGEFEFNIHPARVFALLGLQINSKLASELRFDRIPKYNLRTDAKAPLNTFSLIFYWKVK